MLLNNLSKSAIAVDAMLRTEENLDTLLEIFAIANPPSSSHGAEAEAKYNPNASFHFLSCIFANITTTLQGQLYMLAPSTLGKPRLDRLILSLPATNAIRRGGVLSTLKNVALINAGQQFILSHSLCLESLLKPLISGDDCDKFTAEEMEMLYDGLQWVQGEAEKDVMLKKMGVEVLLLLGSEKNGREKMREIGVYGVMRVLHLGERDESMRDEVERVVDLLIRDEERERIIEIEDSVDTADK